VHRVRLGRLPGGRSATAPAKWAYHRCHPRSHELGSDLMTAVPDWDDASDAELVTAAAAGGRAAFSRTYDRHANRLHHFCIGMLRSRDTAADCVQDVFCIAATRLGQLKDPEKLRPWLYSIARNEALRCIREASRERIYDEVPEMISDE